ncbi:MAG: LLM class flavin-dependent oxidoreductase, partial [Dehalococcoidia bacterium]
MSGLKLGLSFLSESWFNYQIRALARRAEELAFDYLGCGEHVLFHGPVPNAFITLAAAAGATERIRLLSSITLLPLYPPVLAAKLVAMMDVASAGRFDLGVGIGGEFPKEFEACGVPVSQRGARTDEALTVITRLLSEDSVSFRGRFVSFKDVSIQPRPIQKPRPPIWIAGR